jgi:hypothetical protein
MAFAYIFLCAHMQNIKNVWFLECKILGHFSLPYIFEPKFYVDQRIFSLKNS